MSTQIVRPDTKAMLIEQAALRNRFELAKTVMDAATCLAAKKLQADIRLQMKLRHAVLDPFVAIAKKGYDDAKEERAKFIDPLEAMDGELELNRKTWERAEREAAQREQDRINAELRAKAEIEAAKQRKEAEEQARIARVAREKEIEAARRAGDLRKKEAEAMKAAAAKEF